MARYVQDRLTLPYQIGGVTTERPFSRSQSPDGYYRRHHRAFRCERLKATRAHQRTSWSSGFKYTADFSGADWGLSALTQSSTALANPNDGQATARRLRETAVTADHKLGQSFTPASETAHILQLCAKHDGRDWLRFLIDDGTQSFEAWVNLLDGRSQLYAPIVSPTLNNGGFETAGSGGADAFATWTESTTGAGCTIVRDTSVFHSGTASMKLTSDSFDYGGVYQSGILTIGRKYKVTFWAKCTAMNDYTVGVYGGAAPVANQITDTWSQYSATFVAAYSVLAILPTVSVLTSPSCWIDDVTVTPLEPTCLITPDAGGSAVRNGGFETAGTPFGSWTATSTGTGAVTRDTVTFDTGAASAKLAVTTGGDVAYIYQAGLLQVGRRYRVDYKAKRGAAGAVLIHDGSTIHVTQALNTGFYWYSVEFTATAGTLTFLNNTAASEVYLDQVCLTPLDEVRMLVEQLPEPGDSFWRIVMEYYPRASIGNAQIYVSADGAATSYAGDTNKGVILYCPNIRAASLEAPGPFLDAGSTVRTASAPDLDASDPFAYLVEESEPSEAVADVVKISRTFARLPAPQNSYSKREFARPRLHDIYFSPYFAVSFDEGRTSHLFHTADQIDVDTIGDPTATYLNLGNARSTLPHALITFQANNSSQTFYADDSDSSIKNAVCTAISGSIALVSHFSIVRNVDGFAVHCTDTGVTILALSSPSITVGVQLASGIKMGTATASAGELFSVQTRESIVPATRTITTVDPHMGSTGAWLVCWNGSKIVGIVKAIAASGYSITIPANEGPWNIGAITITQVAFAVTATARIANGPKQCDVLRTDTTYLPGVTQNADGTTMVDGDDIPDVTIAADEVGWMGAVKTWLDSTATSVAIAAEAGDDSGQRLTQRVHYLQLADAIESRSLSA